MEAELPAELHASSPCRLRGWRAGPGLTRVGPSKTIIIGCRGHPTALLSSLTTGGDVPPRVKPLHPRPGLFDHVPPAPGSGVSLLKMSAKSVVLPEHPQM